MDASRLEGFLGQLARHLHASTANIISTDELNSVANFVVSYGIPETELHRYATHYHAHDLWRIGAEKLPMRNRPRYPW